MKPASMKSTVPSVGPTPPQGYPAALGVSLLWMAGFVAVSAVVFRRQDVAEREFASMRGE